MTRIPAHKGLYDPDQKVPTLLGSRCEACDTNFFPPLAIGCECCGSSDLAPATLQATGTVHAIATVHRHAGKDIEAPFTVAEIALDDGPLVRGLLTDITEEDIIGSRVAGEWVTTGQNEEGADLVEPRFRTVTEEAE